MLLSNAETGGGEMVEQSCVSRWSKLRKVLLPALVSIMLLTGVIFLIRVLSNSFSFFAGSESGIYWLYVASSETVLILGLVCVIAGVIAVNLIHNLGWVERILLCVFWLIVLVAFLTLLGPDVITYTHTDTALTREGIYYSGGSTDFRGVCPLFGPCTDITYLYTPVIFKCGYAGFWCRAIYHGAVWEYVGLDNSPTTTFSREGSTISLLVDGDVVWEHPVESDGDQ
jgi:hypothetical protein